MDGSIGHLLKSKKGLDGLSDALAFDELFAAGSIANLKKPDIVRKVHEEYVQFSDVITTNTFGCTKFNIDKIPGSSDHEAIDLAAAAAKIARKVADACGRKILVAGKNTCGQFSTAAGAAFYFFRCLSKTTSIQNTDHRLSTTASRKLSSPCSPQHHSYTTKRV
jgi:methionine synthase I (cobalamin-dependent)